MQQHFIEIFEGATSLGNIIGSLAFFAAIAGGLVAIGGKRVQRIKYDEEQRAALEERTVEDQRIRNDIDELRQSVERSGRQNFLMMKSMLKNKCKTAIAAGWCSADDREDINDMNEAYHAAGGNGSMKQYVLAVFELPNEEQEKR